MNKSLHNLAVTLACRQIIENHCHAGAKLPPNNRLCNKANGNAQVLLTPWFLDTNNQSVVLVAGRAVGQMDVLWYHLKLHDMLCTLRDIEV